MNYLVEKLLGIILVASIVGCMTPQEKAIDLASRDQYSILVSPLTAHDGDSVTFSVKSARMKAGEHHKVYLVPSRSDVLSFGDSKKNYGEVDVVSGASDFAKVSAKVALLHPITEKTVISIKVCYSSDDRCIHQSAAAPASLEIDPS